MPLILHEIELDDIGVRNVLPESITFNIRKRHVFTLNKLAQFAKEAYQSKVPVDTYELRDTQIKILKRASQADMRATIGVIDSDHIGSRHQVVPAPLLARLLQRGRGEYNQPLRRTKISDAIPPFSPISAGVSTSGWITNARRAFNASKGKFLSAYQF